MYMYYYPIVESYPNVGQRPLPLRRKYVRGTEHVLRKTPGESFAHFDIPQRIVVKRLSSAAITWIVNSKLRIVLEMHVDWANLGILNQKMMFQFFLANSKRIQSIKNKRLPPTDLTTTNF